MKKIILLITFFFNIGLIFSQVNVTNDNVAATYLGTQTGQSFETSVDGTIISIGVTNNLACNCTLKIYAGATISGTELVSQSVTLIDNYTSSSDYSYQDLILNTPLAVTKNTIYTFQLIGLTELGYSYLNPYQNGTMFVFSERSTEDVAFIISQNPSSLIPVLTTNTIAKNKFTNVSAIMGGNVTHNNGLAIIERGILYSTTDPTPEFGEINVIKDTNGTIGLGSFSETINGLSANTTYYYRAYAINSEGTGYGKVKSFTTYKASPTIVDFDNETWNDGDTHGSNTYISKGLKFVVSNGNWERDTNQGENGSNSLRGATTGGGETITITAENNTDEFDFISFYYNGSGASYIEKIEAFTSDGAISNGVDETNIFSDGSYTMDASKFTNIDKVVITNVNYYYPFVEFLDTFIFINNLPSIITDNANNISLNGANLGGSSIDDKGNAITEKGIVYSFTNTNPEIGKTGVTKDTYGTGNLDFTKNISILKKGTTYYYRAYVINSKGTAYGAIKSFTTLNDIPIVSTTDATTVTANSASLAGNITSQGYSPVTERGILYSSTDTNPKIGDPGVTKSTNGTGVGIFSENITGLTSQTTYYYRAYATNTQGTSYGDVKVILLNNALNFDGTNDRITIADNPVFDFSSGFTAEAWIKPDVLGTQTYLSQYANNQEAFAFILLSSGKIEFTVTTDGSTDQYFESSTAINAGTWSHIALTFNGSVMNAYINGIAAGSYNVSGTMFSSSADIEIGARNNAHFFNGDIDEVRIWTKVLSASEILAQKDKTLPSNTPNLAAYYKMNEGIAEADNSGIITITDSSSNNLSGSLNGFAKSGTSSNFVQGVTNTFQNGIMATNTFAITGNWSTASNWSLGVVPSQVNKTIIASGQTVTIDVDNLVIDDFTLENTATLNIPKDKELTIQNSFSTNGILNLNSDKTTSGVLFVEGTSTGNITYKRGGLLANKWSIVTPPVSGQTIKTFAENTANDIRVNPTPNPNRYAIAYYDDSQTDGNKWIYYDADVSSVTEFIAGQSYSISRSTDGEVSFTGTLAVDDLTKTLIDNKWNAIGNPFTTYYPANKNTSSSFLNDNFTALDDNFKSLYLWDNTQNKYIAVSEVDATSRSLPPGQGFFVFMKSGQTEIKFNENKRSIKPVSSTSTFEKNLSTPSITLKLSNKNNYVTTDIKYFKNATLGLDPGYDIGNFNGASLDVFTRLINNENNNNYTIQSLPNNNFENIVIPIGVTAKKGEIIRFSASYNNLPSNLNLFLEDKIQNKFIDLTNNNTTEEIIIENDINAIGRFYLHTSNKTLSTNINNSLSKVSIFNIGKTIKITNLDNYNSNLQIFSSIGKQVFKSQFKKTGTMDIDLSNISIGVYIVKLETEKGILSKTIILK
ncbi:LamG-like jellyroll fold domain-containing protein [Polaribacter sp. Z022]|uniref:LamG-like jellyroll fold domain-containing protein n=1 Tax=Polaribacter sp. Z022 TaxID=2927125 RepID=UPI0020222ACF|nr:LamG-like jellyroll fold domain-containing protein [Polaribacter sp. Z022]MCL7753651.1 T9SS type A sorting domain-containing protein [Polaribacter sp. Z022]